MDVKQFVYVGMLVLGIVVVLIVGKPMRDVPEDELISIVGNGVNWDDAKVVLINGEILAEDEVDGL